MLKPYAFGIDRLLVAETEYNWVVLIQMKWWTWFLLGFHHQRVKKRAEQMLYIWVPPGIRLKVMMIL